MKAIITRHRQGEYSVMFNTNSQHGTLVFNLQNVGNCWELTNRNGTEVNSWTTKRSMIDYLENKPLETLITLAKQ